MQCVSAVPSLRALVLGHTRVQDAGLAMLAHLPGLTHVALAAEGITQAGLLVSHPAPDDLCSFAQLINGAYACMVSSQCKPALGSRLC